MLPSENLMRFKMLLYLHLKAFYLTFERIHSLINASGATHGLVSYARVLWHADWSNQGLNQQL